MKRPEHPSFFALERHHLVKANPEIAAHLSACATCRAHLESLSAPGPVPGWVRQLQEPRVARRWVLSVATVTASAAAVGIWVGTRPEATTTMRGMPSVAVYILTEGKVRIWDGASAVERGDRIRLKVIPEEFSHVTVFAETTHDRDPNARLVRLMETELSPGQETMLDRSWEITDEAQAETIVVVFAHGPIAEHEAKSGPDRSVRRITIPRKKERAR